MSLRAKFLFGTGDRVIDRWALHVFIDDDGVITGSDLVPVVAEAGAGLVGDALPTDVAQVEGLAQGSGAVATTRQAIDRALAAWRERNPVADELFAALPYRESGTEFSREVWAHISQIPLGETWTYAELAAHAGRPTAARAAGAACGRNPYVFLVPCHRVVPASGGVGRYSGAGGSGVGPGGSGVGPGGSGAGPGVRGAG
ncbi:MAG: methylated-DNA--[protein]-cysteine S-methyltransferase, partial [Actinomycetaceae bacterium]|nr:methylated-DNA--[protein]-cysteine S-methyltransferase [Actinomycetaceae bacterium]